MISTGTRPASALLLAGLALTALVGCSSGKGSATTTTLAPEERISSDADAAAGLRRLVAAANDVAVAGTDKAMAKPAIEKLEPIWQAIEGTVKQKEPDQYAQIEEDLALLDKGADGDASSTRKGADDLVRTVDAYLAKHPS